MLERRYYGHTFNPEAQKRQAQKPFESLQAAASQWHKDTNTKQAHNTENDHGAKLRAWCGAARAMAPIAALPGDVDHAQATSVAIDGAAIAMQQMEASAQSNLGHYKPWRRALLSQASACVAETIKQRGQCPKPDHVASNLLSSFNAVANKSEWLDSFDEAFGASPDARASVACSVMNTATRVHMALQSHGATAKQCDVQQASRLVQAATLQLLHDNPFTDDAGNGQQMVVQNHLHNATDLVVAAIQAHGANLAKVEQSVVDSVSTLSAVNRSAAQAVYDILNGEFTVPDSDVDSQEEQSGQDEPNDFEPAPMMGGII